MARRRVLHALLVAFTLAAGFDVDGTRRPVAPGARPGPTLQGMTSAASGAPQPIQEQAGIRGEVSKWYARYQAFVSGAAKVSRFINMGCGVWLVVTAPFSMIGSVLRPFEVVLLAYLCAFGALMFAIEVPLGVLQRVVKQYFLFVFTRPGRAFFVVLVAAIASILKHVGMVTKALLLFNAGLNFYILNSQDRRFAQTDDQAKRDLDAISAELRENAQGALSMGKYLGFGKIFGSTSSEPAATGFDPGFDGSGGGAPPDSSSTWPGGGDA